MPRSPRPESHPWQGAYKSLPIRSRRDAGQHIEMWPQGEDGAAPARRRIESPRTVDVVADLKLRQQYLDLAELLGSVDAALSRRAVVVLAAVGDVEDLDADEAASLALCGCAAQ